MELAHTIALTMGLAWASGINLYAALLMLGLMGATGHVALPPGLEPLTHPLVIGAAGFMYCVEFFADKIPGVDNGWDSMHTFVRIPAGAVLAAAAVGDVSMPAQIAAALLGGTLSAGTHATKAGGRIMINGYAFHSSGLVRVSTTAELATRLLYGAGLVATACCARRWNSSPRAPGLRRLNRNVNSSR